MVPINFKFDKETWSEAVQKAIRELTEAERNIPEKVLKPAVKSGIGIIAREARALAPGGTFGLLKKSIATKVTYNQARNTVTGIVGPKRGLKRFVIVEFDIRDRRTGRIRHYKLERYSDPVKYAHIVEKGTWKQPGGYRQPKLKLTHPTIPGRTFLGAAFENTKQAVEVKLVEQLKMRFSELIIK